VRFPAGIDGDYVTIDDATLQKTVRQFLELRSSSGQGTVKPGTTTAKSAAPKKSSSKKSSSKKKTSKGSSTLAPGLVRAKVEAEDLVATMSTKAGKLPVYYPAVRTDDGFATEDNPRLYTIKDRAGYAYKAYRIVGYAGQDGQYWGVQGTSWRSPPILDDPGDTETLAGRKYNMYYDGTRLRLIAWRTRNGVYWVSNTLSRTLTNQQMRDIAKSLTRVGT
jgi:hypothetical protein